MSRPATGWQAAGAERFRHVIDFMEPRPDDRLLEIGCGNGVSVAMICDLLADGHITAIDRSRKMIERAVARNAAHIAAGKAALLAGALNDAPLSGPFGKVFAVNVNVFWMKPARELARVKALLAPGGSLFLFYQPPAGTDVAALQEKLRRNLEEAGLKVARAAQTSTSAIVTSCMEAKAA